MTKANRAARRAHLSVPFVEPTPPVRDVTRLETRWSPQPTITTWLSMWSGGELLWESLDSARKQAELGLTESWGDVTRRMLATDDHVLSTYLTYVNAIANARREFIPRKVAPEHSEIAEAQAVACEEMMLALPSAEQSIAELVDGDFTGWAIQEILWAPRGQMLYPTNLVWMHPARFRFSQRFVPYLYDRGLAAQRAKELGFGDAGYGRDAVDGLGLPLPQNKYIVHMPRMIPNYPMVSGIFLSVMRPWFVKSWCTKFALSGAEVAGNPRMVGNLPADNSAPAAVRDELYAALRSLSADSVGVVSGGTTVEILDPKMEGTGGVWDYLLKRCDAAISKAILGSTLNVEVGDTGGNRSLGESQADTTMAPRWARSSAMVSNTLEQQLLRPFLEFNRHLWGGHVFVPQMKLHITDEDPAVDAVAVDSGVVKIDELRRSRKLEPLGAEAGGDVLIAAKTQPADATIYKSNLDARVAAPASPTGTPDQPAAGADVAASAFNGAQVTSLQGMLASVNDGTLAPGAAVIAIKVAFPTVSDADARAMVEAQSGAPTPGGSAPRPFDQKVAASRQLLERALSTRLR